MGVGLDMGFDKLLHVLIVRLSFIGVVFIFDVDLYLFMGKK